MPIKTISEKDLDIVDPLIRHDHPRFVLQELNKIIKSVGNRKFLHSPEYGNERDLFIGSMFAFYVRKIQQREQFIQKPKEFPDVEISAFSDRKISDRPLDNAHVEITSIPEGATSFNEALKIIQDSKLDKIYQPDKELVLLIFINNKHAPLWAKGLSDFFQSSNDGFGQVYALYLLGVNPKDSFVYEVDSLRPAGSAEILRLSEEIRKQMIQHPYLERFARRLSGKS
jgi:hypothetical protein